MTRLVAIVPTCRPKNWPRVLHMLRAQTRQLDAVVVVENGAAVGRTHGATVTLTSSPNVGAARQEGLAYVQRHYPGSFFAFFDDDDDYGPCYLRELYASRKRATIVGKREVFYRLAASGVVIVACPGLASRPVEYVHGPTMAGWTDDAEPFTECDGWGEDIDWQRRMRAKGATVYATSGLHFCGVRAKTCDLHTWSLPDLVIGRSFNVQHVVRNFGPAVMAGRTPPELAPLATRELAVNLPLPGAA